MFYLAFFISNFALKIFLFWHSNLQTDLNTQFINHIVKSNLSSYFRTPSRIHIGSFCSLIVSLLCSNLLVAIIFASAHSFDSRLTSEPVIYHPYSPIPKIGQIQFAPTPISNPFMSSPLPSKPIKSLIHRMYSSRYGTRGIKYPFGSL